MKLLALALLLSACAVGHVSPSGDVYGLAVGHAKLEHCSPAMESPSDQRPPRQECKRIQGGALSSGASEFIGNVLTALVAWFAA